MNNIFLKTLPSKIYSGSILAQSPSLPALRCVSAAEAWDSHSPEDTAVKTARTEPLTLQSYTSGLADWALLWIADRNLISQWDHLLPRLCTRDPFQAEDGLKHSPAATAECRSQMPACQGWDVQASPEGLQGRGEDSALEWCQQRTTGTLHWGTSLGDPRALRGKAATSQSLTEWPWEWFGDGEKGKELQV